MNKLIVTLCLLCATLLYAQQPTISVSTGLFQSCVPTHSAASIRVMPGEAWHDYAFYQSGSYVRVLTNHQGCDSIVDLEVEVMNGALQGRFSVSATEQVYFSQGNLQYCAAPAKGDPTHMTQDGPAQGVWRFAPKQYDMIGGPICNDSTSATYRGWVDYFGFGADGYNGRAPYLMTSNNSDYATSTIANTKSDWGVYNAISNGGNSPDKWRLLTKDEWVYLYQTRPRATVLRGLAMIEDICGYVFFPDDWTDIEDIPFNPSAAYYTGNPLTMEQWERLEAHGAVFLPAAGSRDGGVGGRYWSSVFASGTDAYVFRWEISSSSGSGTSIVTYPDKKCTVSWGYTVRLVKNVK